MEFHPGAQKNGFKEGGADSGPDSIENARAESGSSGGSGSCTLMLASIAVRPLYRFGWRAILLTALCEGATFGIAPNAGVSAAIAVMMLSRFCHCVSLLKPAATEPSRSHRQLSCTSGLGSRTWK